MEETGEHSEKNVIRLGWVSLLNDIGSETIIRLVPFYLSGVLGASMAVVGAIEGMADATATLLKPYFGRISDRSGKRKSFVLAGYAVSAASRPLLAIAGTPVGVAVLRILDRFGKSVRTAPRDSLISVTQSKKKQGLRFGINRAMDTAGAVLGIGLFAVYVYYRTRGTGSLHLTAPEWEVLCLASLVPSLLCVAIVFWGIVEVPGHSRANETVDAHEARASRVLKKYLFTVAVFGLANSSDAFILLRSRAMGFSLLQTLGMIVLLNVFSSATALPASTLSDRFGRKTLILSGWLIYAATYTAIGLGFGEHSALLYGVLLGFYGLFYGFTESVEKAWVADLTPAADRGSAYGWFGLITGITALPASAVFGWAWDRYGDRIPFLAGAAIAYGATLLLLVLVPGAAEPNPS